MENNDTLTSLFQEHPGQWGLRGDPFLWEDLKERFSSAAWPDSCEEFENILGAAFFEMTGASLSQEGHVFLKKYDHGGMSSGHVHIDAWRDALCPLLLQRFYKKKHKLLRGGFIRLRICNDQLNEKGLTQFDFPVPLREVKSFIAPEFKCSDLLCWLQSFTKSLRSPEKIQALEPVMHSLTTLVEPSCPANSILLEQDGFSLLLGDVDLTKEIVTIQKGEEIIAAINNNGDGRLLVSLYRAPCNKTISYLTGLAQKPSRDGRVSLRPSNWEYALDCTTGIGNAYADQRGEAYLSYWDYGLGKLKNGTSISPWIEQVQLQPLPKAQIVRHFV